jgi:hypothetical protein
MQHPLEVFLTPLGLLPTEDPEDPAWCERVGNVASLIDHTTPLHTVQGLVGCALYRLQALRSISTTDMMMAAHTVSADGYVLLTCTPPWLGTWIWRGTLRCHSRGSLSWRHVPVESSGRTVA